MSDFFNPLDIAVFVFFFLGVIIGMKKGFSEMFLSLIKNVFVLFLCLNYLYVLSDMVEPRILFSHEATLCLIFTVSFLIMYIGLTLAFFFLKKIVEIRWIEPLNSLLGALLGIVNSAVLLSACVLFFTFIPSPLFFRQIYGNSYSGYFIARTLVFVHNKLFYYFPVDDRFDGERFMDEINTRIDDRDL